MSFSSLQAQPVISFQLGIVVNVMNHMEWICERIVEECTVIVHVGKECIVIDQAVLKQIIVHHLACHVAVRDTVDELSLMWCHGRRQRCHGSCTIGGERRVGRIRVGETVVSRDLGLVRLDRIHLLIEMLTKGVYSCQSCTNASTDPTIVAVPW